MQHLDEGTIHSWLDGALSADEASRVAAHVAECPQCAAAVAEARGFIAASSRILTALDHVPHGVVPAAHPVKWYNRAVWRAAAAVLVVGVGSLVV
ncbi:MAG TPA: zf-HC2 domain-containing protein, partial [Gemmatimonadaceae bacterium]|nr:zf-HC2 domain-containing protein [Gemmatimonadaceae bacterium]